MEKVDVGKRVRRKRVSKKTKKSWRKHSDIKDVEAYLEDQRLQERTGGLVAEKSDAELFVVDRKTGDATPSEKRVRGQPRLLRCHAALVSDARIAPARTERAATVPKLKENDDEVVKKTDTRLRSSSKRSKNADKQKSTGSSRLKRQVTTAGYDLWGSNDITAPPAGVDEHYLDVCKKKRIRPPSHYCDKPSDLPAIEVPHPGMSYRPTLHDHQALLHMAAVVENKRLREERRIKRALDDKFPTINEAPNEDTWLKEWAAADQEEDVDNDAGKPEGDAMAGVSHNPPVRRENKKTERERKRLKAVKEAEKEAQRVKEEKIRRSGVLRLKSAKKEVLRREMALAARATRRQLLAEKTGRTTTRRLGRVKYEDPTIDLKLTEEQVDSLRLLKPEGSVLRDHLNSLQKRNIIEPRRRAKVIRKYKLKVYEKKSHRAIAD